MAENQDTICFVKGGLKMNKIKMILAISLVLGLGILAAGCGSKNNETTTAATEAEKKKKKKTEAATAETSETEATTEQTAEKTELTILAAASLTDVMEEIKTMYEADHNVSLTFSFAGSGALQTQIEEGAPADVFVSAAKKQMKALSEESLMKDETVCSLLENKVVLIVPKGSELTLSSFEDVKNDEVKMIGIGEVESVPAGQYAKTVFTNLNMWDEVEAKANFGTDVRTVLGWVETSAVDCGVVYATDAYSSDEVRIVAEAPEGSCDPVIYPAGVIASSKNAEEAAAFVDFLKTDEAMAVFERYGFVKAVE